VAVYESIINSNTVVQYVPGVGLVESVITEGEEGEEAKPAFMIYAAPETIHFSQNAAVETVMRTVNTETGQSSLAMFITWQSTGRDLHEFVPSESNPYPPLIATSVDTVTLTMPNGEEIVLTGQSGGTGSSTPPGGPTTVYREFRYRYEDFPEINEFTLTAGGISVEVKLEPRTPNALFGQSESNGITVSMMQLSKGSRAMAYEIDNQGFDFSLFYDSV
jgi:hypothetical protein